MDEVEHATAKGVDVGDQLREAQGELRQIAGLPPAVRVEAAYEPSGASVRLASLQVTWEQGAGVPGTAALCEVIGQVASVAFGSRRGDR